jgi:hypothetical protein
VEKFCFVQSQETSQEISQEIGQEIGQEISQETNEETSQESSRHSSQNRSDEKLKKPLELCLSFNGERRFFHVGDIRYQPNGIKAYDMSVSLQSDALTGIRDRTFCPSLW